MAFPTSTAFSAGQTAGVSTSLNAIRADLNSINRYVIKTADESVAGSTTQQNDDHLFLSISATGTYVFDVFLYGVSAADNTGDLSVAFTFPTGTLHYAGLGGVNTITTGSSGSGEFIGRINQTTGTATSSPYAMSTAVMGIHLHGVLIATATGTLQMTWAQASASGTTTLKAGSHMIMRQVA